MKPAWIIGFSGHRNLRQPDLVRAGIQVAISRCKQRVEQGGGQLHLYVSAAYGADLLAISVAEELGLPVHLVLPKPVVFLDDGTVSRVEGFASDFTDAAGEFLPEEWEKAHAFIRKADRGEQGWTYRLVSGSQVEPECYYDAGVQVMEAADCFLAVWDGEAARGLGGTAEMVEQARAVSMPLQIVDPSTGHLTEEGFATFSVEKDEGHQLMQALPLKIHGSTKEQFHYLDELANVHSQAFRNTMVKGIWINAGATITAAVAALLQGASLAAAQWIAALALAEWVLVVIAWMRIKRMSRGQTHANWVRSRFAVELMRSMFGSHRLLDPLHPPVARHKVEWQRFAITAGLQLATEQIDKRTWQEERDVYVAMRLDDPQTGQIPHFLAKQKEAAPVFDRLTKLHKRVSYAAVVFVFGAFLYKGTHAMLGTFYQSGLTPTPGLQTIAVVVFFRFFPIALPLIAGISLALRNAKDSGRRKIRYLELSIRLTKAREQLLRLKTESSCRRCVGIIEEVLLDELIEWHLSERKNSTK